MELDYCVEQQTGRPE